MTFNFQDIFKSSFLENVDSIPVLDMVLALMLSFALGLFVAYVYKNPMLASCIHRVLG